MNGRPDWREMTRTDFDVDAREVQGALFPADDRAGTGDMLELLEGAGAAWPVRTLDESFSSRLGESFSSRLDDSFSGRARPLCCGCFERVHGFEPDMGLDVSWAPGDCSCGSAGIIVFALLEVPA